MGLPAVKNVSLKVHRGEVVGIAGVQGNGQSELADAISGLLPLMSGEIDLFRKASAELILKKRPADGKRSQHGKGF